jgi:prepilin-type N-terminal cleavage/methylation domain-containing protein
MSRFLQPTPSRRSRGFTLVEILVVVAIIVILMAILIPVAMRAIGQARNAAIGVELSQLKGAMDDYKREHGDYPPSLDWDPGNAATGNIPANFGAQQAKWWDNQNQRPSNYAYTSVCEQHLLRCYPKSTDKFKFYRYIAPLIEQDEALVFWLYMIANDPREPFKNFAYNSNNGNIYYAGGINTNQLVMSDFPGSYNRFSHFDFDARRLVDGDGDGIPGYVALYSKGTTYMYFDSRTYSFTQTPPYAARLVAQPITDGVKIAQLSPTLPNNNPQKNDPRLLMFVNPNTFQILCSGQDGNFGLVTNAYANGPFSWDNFKQFPTMLNCNEEDSDNMTDFTEGRRLIDHRP